MLGYHDLLAVMIALSDSGRRAPTRISAYS